MTGYDNDGLPDMQALDTESRIAALERRIAALEERITREYAQFLEEEMATAIRWTGGV